MALPEISVSRVNMVETSDYVTFRVTLSQASEDEVTMSFRGTEGTASTADFSSFDELRTGTLTIAAGETTGLISFRMYGDSTDEVDESFWLELYNAQNGVLSGGGPNLMALGVVQDNDGSGSNLSLFVGSPTLVEGNSGTKKAVFEVHLSQPYASDVTFSFRTADGTAKAGSDYVAKTGSITFLAGQTVASIEVDVRGDGFAELSEFFSLIVTPTGAIRNGTLGSTGIATILDNDTSAALPEISVSRVNMVETSDYVTFRVTLSQVSDDDVTMSFRGSEGTASTADFSSFDELRTGTLTIAAGETTGLISFRMYGDSTDEVDESFWLELFNAQNGVLSGGGPNLMALGVVQDNDGSGSNLSLFVGSPTLVEGNSGTKKAVFEVHLSQPYASDVTFSFRTADGTAKAGSDYVAKTGSITFLAGQTVASIEIDVRGDGIAELSEFFSLIVTPTGAIKNGTLGSTGIATILDNDTSAALPEISVSRVNMVETSDYVTFRVTLSQVSDDDVTMSFRGSEGTATTADFSSFDGLRTGTLTIAAGETTGLISFRMYGDSTDEVDESFWLELFNAQNGVLSGGGPNLMALGVVQDNDGSGSNLSLFVGSPTLVEGNSGTKKAVFEVHLSQPYASDVTFSFRTADGTAKAGSDYVAKTGSITFRAGQTVASIEIDVKGDTAIESNEFFSLVLTATSVIKNGTPAHVGQATIVNNDSIHQTIYGTSGHDKLYGYAGNDTLYGRAGNDLLDGGQGADKLHGETGNDTYIVDSANDRLFEKAGEGTDLVKSAITFTLGGNIENLTLTGAKAINGTGNSLNNTITGNGAANRLGGGFGADVLNGGTGNDSLNGGAGNDRLYGSAGNDRLYGADGADDLYGGAGADIFVFMSIGDTTPGAGGRDTIYDFSGRGGDRINLAAIDASTRASGNQAFAFIGTEAFSKKAGELRYQKGADESFVFGDVNGDGRADFTIHIDQALGLSKDFFIL